MEDKPVVLDEEGIRAQEPMPSAYVPGTIGQSSQLKLSIPQVDVTRVEETTFQTCVTRPTFILCFLDLVCLVNRNCFILLQLCTKTQLILVCLSYCIK